MLAISDGMAGCYVHVDGHREDRDDERGALDNQELAAEFSGKLKMKIDENTTANSTKRR
jgi:hypothetical protein